MTTWREAFAQLERWVFTPECMVCQRPITSSEDELVCDLCRMRWQRVAHPQCATCGEPLLVNVTCRLCTEWPAGFGPVRSAVRLDANARRLVHQFKYAGWWRLAESFAAAMHPLLRSWPDAPLVPVPLSSRRLRSRGYNQAEKLASALANVSGRVVDTTRMRRIRDTGTQTRLTPETRRSNLAGAFGASDAALPAIIVDDVFTTGATLTSAATVLLEAGAPWVRGITFARAEPPLASAAERLGYQHFAAEHGDRR